MIDVGADSCRRPTMRTIGKSSARMKIVWNMRKLLKNRPSHSRGSSVSTACTKRHTETHHGMVHAGKIDTMRTEAVRPLRDWKNLL